MEGRVPLAIHEMDDLEKIALDENTDPLVRRAINRMAYLEMENKQLRAAYGLIGAVLKNS